MRYKTFISFFLSILLSVQNITYAMDAMGKKEDLEIPLLSVGQQSSLSLRMPSSGDMEMRDMGQEEISPDDQGSALSLPPPSSPLKTFLETYNLTSDDIESRGLSLERLQELLRTDTTWLTSFRWMAVDGSVEKVLDYSVLGRGAITHSDDDLKGKWCDQRVWMNGRDLPILSKSARQNLLFMEGFRNGIGYVFFRELHLTVLGFLGYDLITSIQNGNLSFDTLVSVFSTQETATINYLLGLLQNPAGPYIVTSILGAPLVWGVTKGLWNIYAEKHSTLQNRIKLQEEIKDYPKGKWGDSGRWMLPFHPIDRKLNTLIRDLRFNGEMTSEEVEEIFNTLKQLTTERSGYSQIVGMHHLANLAYGINLIDYAKFVRNPEDITEEEREKLLTYLHLKLESYSIIHDMAEDIFQKWKARENATQGADIIWKGIYAKYLMWSLGQDNWGWIPMGGLKAAKATLFGFFLKTLIESLITYFQCPETFQHLRYGEIGPISDTLECFNEYVRIFNQIPGQPVETLTSLIPHVSFPNNQYELDLSNHGIGNVTTIIQILDAFYENHIDLTSINLSGNLQPEITPKDYGAVGKAIGQYRNLRELYFGSNNLGICPSGSACSSSTVAFLNGWVGKTSYLTSLHLSDNGIGSSDSAGTTAIGEGLKYLSRLTSLDLSGNRISFINSKGVIAIGEGFKYLSRLTSLDLSGNYIGLRDSTGTVAIGDGIKSLSSLTLLDLSGNSIGFSDSAGTAAIGEGLKSLSSLTALDLSGNFLGYTNTTGTVAIGEGLKFLSHLTYLVLSANFIGFTNGEGIVSLSEGFSGTPFLQSFIFFPQAHTIGRNIVNMLNQGLKKTKAPLLPLIITSPEEMSSYLNSLPKNTTSLGLSGLFNDPTVAVINSLFQGIRENAFSLTSLDLSDNAIGSSGSTETVAIGDGLKSLSSLTSLDLSGNSIGFSDSTGTVAIGEGLKSLSYLTSLDLSGNRIGNTDSTGTVAIGEGLKSLSSLTQERKATSLTSGLPRLGLKIS